MNPEDLAHFKARLDALVEEIRAQLALADPAQESIVPDDAIGRLTRMEAIQAQAMTAAGRRRLSARLQQIDRALTDLDEGRYGQCVRCGEAIPHGRLEVVPEARLCVSCAARSR